MEHLAVKIAEYSKKTPQKTAITHRGRAISYSEFEKEANKIANYLYDRVKENKNVALLLDRSPELIESVVGLLKCGFVFAPVDPDYPQGRIEKYLKIAGAEWIITSTGYYEKFRDIIDRQGFKVLLIDKAGGAGSLPANVFVPEDEAADELRFAPVYNNHCYIIFTSGSLGVPKGILGRHRSLVHFIEWEINEFGVTEYFNISQISSPSFDPFLRDTFVPLAAGGTCCVIDNNEMLLDPGRFKEWIDHNDITLMHIVPSLFKLLVNEIKDDDCFEKLEYILLAGELLRGEDIRTFIEIFKRRIELANLYGPAETTMSKSFYRVKEADARKSIIPVGKPLPGAQTVILDENMKICLTGNVGEIYIRTPFRSAGYIGDPELTKKVFIKNPYGNNPKDIIYKTGDLGKLLGDGNMEVLGRVDHQLKIRGHRVELGEIESVMLKFEKVKDAVVVAGEDKKGGKYLCAYFVAEEEIEVSQLREYLSRELPGFMVPSYFVQIDKMPLTDNGKADRKKLPEPELKASKNYIAPGNESEKKIVEIWSEVLGIEEKIIGIDDNFFELGGHSINMTRVVSLIHKELHVHMPLAEVFKAFTVRDLSAYIKKAEKNKYIAIEKAPEQAYYPLSSAQKRLYTLQLLEKESTGYNISLVLELAGAPDKEKFDRIFMKLIERHESLRTSFHMIAGEPVQKINDPRAIDFKIEYIEAGSRDQGLGISVGARRAVPETDRRDLIHQIQSTAETQHLASQEPGSDVGARRAVPELINRFIRPFDLSQAPLLRVGLVRNDSGEKTSHLLVVDMHHIISDRVSLDVLQKDFAAFDQGGELAPLNLHYKDFAFWQDRQTREGEFASVEAFWLNEFAGELPSLDLPIDYPRQEMRDLAGSAVEFSLGRELTGALKELALREGVTMQIIMLAILNVLFFKVCGQEDIIIGTPAAGRRHADLLDVIGLFVNTMALRNYPKAEKSFREFLREVGERSLSAYDNQDYPFDDLVGKVRQNRDRSRSPLFDVMFEIHTNLDEPDGKTGTKEERDTDEAASPSNNPGRDVTKMDIDWYGIESRRRIDFIVFYSTRLFKRETIERLTRHYVEIIEQVLADSEIKLKDIALSHSFVTAQSTVSQEDEGDFGF